MNKPTPLTPIQAIVAERQRQQREEGWTPEHDDQHIGGELATAAGCYALISTCHTPGGYLAAFTRPHAMWPFSHKWWKPKNPRADLVKAGALILAEIERLDRKANAQAGAGHAAD